MRSIEFEVVECVEFVRENEIELIEGVGEVGGGLSVLFEIKGAGVVKVNVDVLGVLEVWGISGSNCRASDSKLCKIAVRKLCGVLL